MSERSNDELLTELAAIQADKTRMRDRIERLRGALKTCAGRFLDYDDLAAHEDCMRWAGDMEPPP